MLSLKRISCKNRTVSKNFIISAGALLSSFNQHIAALFILHFQRITRFSIPLLICFSLLTFPVCRGDAEKSDTISQSLLLLRLKNILGTSSTSRTTNVPSRISINLPSSLRASSSMSKAKASLKENKSKGKALSAPTADGYLAIKSSVQKFSKLANDVAFEILVLDSVINEAKLNPGVCINGGALSIKVTEDMIALVKASFLETGLSPIEAEEEVNFLQEEGELPVAGTSIPSPAILYNKLSGDFDHQVLYSFANNFAIAKKCPTTGRFNKALKFTSDFKKISFGHQENMKIGLDIIIMEGNITIETSAIGKKRLTFLNNFKIDTANHSSLLILEECTKGDVNGDCLIMEQFYREDDTADSSRDVIFKIKGRVNDTGGLVEFTQKFTHTNIAEEERELFDKDGVLTGYEIKQSGNWVPSPSFPHLDINDNSISFDDHGFDFDFPSINVTLNNCNEIANFDVFVIVQEGENPSLDPTAMIGSGFKDTSLELDYWGSESEIIIARVWKYSHATSSFIETANSCKVIKQ